MRLSIAIPMLACAGACGAAFAATEEQILRLAVATRAADARAHERPVPVEDLVLTEQERQTYGCLLDGLDDAAGAEAAEDLVAMVEVWATGTEVEIAAISEPFIAEHGQIYAEVVGTCSATGATQ